MKKYFRLIVLGLIACYAISCDEFLETDSNSTLTETTTFSNLDFATKAVYGVYDNLTDKYLYDYFIMYYKVDNDIEACFQSNNGRERSIAHYAADENSSYLAEVWNLLYKTIEQANLCIDNLPKSAIWEGEYSNEARALYGEAVTLRAYCYYELICQWGDVPFMTKSTEAGDDFYVAKTDRDEIYEYLIEDLKNVKDYVPWMSETQTTERINKAYVKGLRARMALSYAGYSLRNKTFETRRGRYWEDYYKIAKQECEEVMISGKHQLNPSFENIFKTLHTYDMDLNTKEVLFEVAFGRLKGYGRVAESWGMAHSTSSDKKYGRAPCRLACAVPFYFSFDTEDIRRNTSIEMYNYGYGGSNAGKQVVATPINMGFCKFRREWIQPSMGGDLSGAYYTGVNWPMMRYSDIILMYAESENEINGPTQNAKDALALVRQRAFPSDQWASKVTSYIDSVSVSKESFFNAIVDERAWEFGGELIRKQDLVRWNLLGSKMFKMKEDFEKILTDDASYEYHDKVPPYLFWKRADDDETMEILNPDYRLPSNSIEGYTKAYYFPKYSSSNRSKYRERYSYVGNGFDITKNNHLQPIDLDLITASGGVLENDQIP